MFQLTEKFLSYDDNLQPYTLVPERHTPIDNLHGKVEKGEYGFNSIGNRMLLQTPPLGDFSLELGFGFTLLQEIGPDFTVIFHYDKRTRRGLGLRLRCILPQGLAIELVSVEKIRVTVLAQVDSDTVTITEGQRYTLSMALSEGCLRGSAAGVNFAFPVPEGRGFLALERKNYIGQWLVSEFSVTSLEVPEETVLLPQTSVQIPLTDGGDIPYRLTWEARDAEGVCYLDYTLSEGTASRKLNREDRPGQYVAEMDAIHDPFIRLRRGNKSLTLYIRRGRIVLVDPNVYWECLKDYWQMPEYPLSGSFPVPRELLGPDTTVSYGYAHFQAEGYAAQAAGPSEYIFTADGQLLYGGQALAEIMLLLRSPEDKKALSLVEDVVYEREAVLDHLKNNHYFAVDEEIRLTLCVRTLLDPAGFTVKAEIRDIYDRETLWAGAPTGTEASWLFGYRELSFPIVHPPMTEKLYRVRFTLTWGGRVMEVYERVFEVYDPDSKISPPMASGLPFVFSMPNEQKWLSRNTYDFWSPQASCDAEHYISCVTDTPIEGQRKEVWKTTRPFKREWFAWLGSRTTLDWSFENNMPLLMNCDYLSYGGYYRSYMHWLKSYTYKPERRARMRAFLAEHPEFAEKLSFTLPEETDAKEISMLVDEAGMNQGDSILTFQTLKEFTDVCYPQWCAYDTALTKEATIVKDRKFRELNPKLRRANYGPFAQYANSTSTYHHARSTGVETDDSLADIQDGFFIYEDYPNACGYQTYRGPLCVATSLLHSPRLTIYPEQYRGAHPKAGPVGGCIDGAVKYANSPMGTRSMPEYFPSTHAFEFVFNTPQRVPGGWRYWNTYGFHRADFYTELLDRVAKDWKYALDYKPAAPYRAPAFLAEYSLQEDSMDIEVENLQLILGMKNRSADGHGQLYNSCREAGLNAAFVLRWETLRELRPEECDLLFLPSLKDAEPWVLAELRRLHNAGVPLAAVSDVTGLEDLFGVRPCDRAVEVDTLEFRDREEFIYPLETQFTYEPADSEVLASASGQPLILRKGRNLLFAAALVDIGYSCFEGFCGTVRYNVSPLMKEILITVLRESVTPPVLGRNVGVTLFRTEQDKTVLLAIDYSPLDNRPVQSKEAEIALDLPGIRSAKADFPLSVLTDSDGCITALRFTIQPQGFAFVELS